MRELRRIYEQMQEKSIMRMASQQRLNTEVYSDTQ